MRTKPISLKPQTQGHIDGMCAVYATLNGCKYLFQHAERSDERLLRYLCEKVIPDLFPKIMYEGADTRGVRRLLAGAAEWTRANHHRDLLFSAPAWRRKFASVEDYFAFLRETLATGDNEGAVFIVGLADPWFHWTVLTGVTETMAYFFDSWGLPDTPIADFTLDEDKAGEGPGEKTMIDCHQTFLMRLPRRKRPPG